jgi:DNA replicative helicase MCM subunit Mcm2 (Cdc46/Mcm family)
LEEKLLIIIGELDRSARGAEWDDVIRTAMGRQIPEEQVSQAVEGLLDKGMVYEPVLGRMKRI